MSVWPISGSPCLSGTDGELVSISITTEPRLLEKLLDTLAQMDFPINPQLYHHADARTPFAIVEFPAWSGRLAKVREALTLNGFPETALAVRSMYEALRGMFPKTA